MKYTLSLFFVLSFSMVAQGVNKEYLFENNLICQTLSFDNSRIRVTSTIDKINNCELSSKEAVPYFEFTINRHTVTSNDPLWQLQKVSQRKMDNNGTETTFIIAGKKQLSGLFLTLQRQFFPGSTMIRERLLLRSSTPNKFRLNKVDGKIHFIFPRYAFSNLSECTSEEIRIGSFNGEILSKIDTNATYDNRTNSYNLAHAHMFHPQTIRHSLTQTNPVSFKGPFAILSTGSHLFMSTYEHASQDDLNGFNTSELTRKGELFSIDEGQGVKGDPAVSMTDEDFHFISLGHQVDKEKIIISNQIERGGYFDNEPIPSETKSYETVWSTLSVLQTHDDVTPAIRQYLLHQITERKITRTPHFYYNTWGMQRESVKEGKKLREIMTQERILEEIGYAAQLGVDLFVLDDGWEEAHGVWTPNRSRLPNGLLPLIDELKRHNITPGAWLSPLGIDSLAQRFVDYPEWVITTSNGKPILAQWDQPAFDVVGGFAKLLLEDHKKLIDQGIRFFKWDAINTFNSSLTGLDHGDESHTKKERIDRYNYLLPFYITRIMEEITAYHPEVLIEIDLTEAERCMIGLMPLQQGKFFWMNNGASSYGDYSSYRTKSMRTIVNEYASILPPEVFTFANYPYNAAPYRSLRYNINTSLIAGRGFWGSLKQMTEKERFEVGRMVNKSKRVMHHIAGFPLEVSGKIGASPELYLQRDSLNGYAQLIGFSGSACQTSYAIGINTHRLLGVLDHSYNTQNDSINLNLSFTTPDDTRQAFVLGNDGSGFSVLSSSGWLENITVEGNILCIKTGAPSRLFIRFPNGQPTVNGGRVTDLNGKTIQIEAEGNTLLTVESN